MGRKSKKECADTEETQCRSFFNFNSMEWIPAGYERWHAIALLFLKTIRDDARILTHESFFVTQGIPFRHWQQAIKRYPQLKMYYEAACDILSERYNDLLQYEDNGSINRKAVRFLAPLHNENWDKAEKYHANNRRSQTGLVDLAQIFDTTGQSLPIEDTMTPKIEDKNE